MKDKYNRYYHKKCRNVTIPTNCNFFLQREIALSPQPPLRRIKKADQSRIRSESISTTWQVSKITNYSWKKWQIVEVPRYSNITLSDKSTVYMLTETSFQTLVGNINIWEKIGMISNSYQFVKKYSIFEEIHLGTYLTVMIALRMVLRFDRCGSFVAVALSV